MDNIVSAYNAICAILWLTCLGSMCNCADGVYNACQTSLKDIWFGSDSVSEYTVTWTGCVIQQHVKVFGMNWDGWMSGWGEV